MMHRLVRAFASILLSLLFVVVGCKKTAEGETAKWTANVATVDKLQAQYPGFKPALEARVEKARAIYDAASSLSGDAQIDKMAEANQTLTRGFVSDLGALEKTMKELREKRVEAAAQAGDESVRLAAKVAAEDVGKTMDRVEATLETGAADDSSADAVLKKITADLASARSSVDKVLAVDEKKKQDAAAKDEAKADAESKDKADAEAKVADWKCEYCNSVNKHDHTACESCGAPRGGAKAAADDAKANKE